MNEFEETNGRNQKRQKRKGSNETNETNVRVIPKRRFAQNQFEHTEKEVRPKRRFGPPSQKSISLKWHILTSSRLYSNKQHIRPQFKLIITKSSISSFSLISEFSDFQNISFQATTNQHLIIANVNNSKSPYSIFQCSRDHKSHKYAPKCSVRNLFTLLGHLLNIFEKMSKTFFKPCYHIEFNTTNPNPIFKITIYCTKTPTMSKYFRNLEK